MPVPTSQKNVRWAVAPKLSAVVGTPKTFQLADYIRNAENRTVAFSLGIGYTYPAGWSGNAAGLVSWDGTGAAVRTPMRWRASTVSPNYTVASSVGYVEAKAAPVQTPVAPINVAATALSTSVIEVAWAPGVGGSTPVSYEVWESSAAGGPWDQIDNVSASPYTRTDLAPLSHRWYYVVVVDANGAKAQSVADDAETFDDPLPHAVQSVGAQGTSTTTIRVSWSPPADGPTPTGYQVHRSTLAGGPFTPLASPAASPHNDTPLPAGESRWYKVRAMNGANEGPLSVAVTGTTLPVVQPSIPINLTAGPLSATQIKVDWAAGLGGSTITQYRVERSLTSGSGYGQIGTTVPPVVTYTDSTLSEGQTRWYRVRAYDGTNVSDASVEKSATTYNLNPNQPVNLHVVPLASAPTTALHLTWQPGTGPGSPTVTYQVHRTVILSPATWVPLQSGLTSPTYDDTTLSPGQTRYYYVAAFDAQGDSSNASVHGEGTTSSAPGPSIPVSVAAGGTSISVIRVTWQPGPGGSTITNYKVWWATSSGGNYTAFPAVSATPPLFYDHTNLPASTTRWYRVSALDGVAESAQSPYTSGQTQAPPASNTVTLSWNSPTAGVGTGGDALARYRLEWGTVVNNQFGTFINSTSVPHVPGQTVYSATVRLPNGLYAFRVIAIAVDNDEGPPGYLGTRTVQ